MIMKYLKYIKFFILILWVLSIYIFLEPWIYKELWDISWKLLIIVLFIRPLRDIFPNFKLFSYILIFRRELWIITWLYAIMHWIWYFLDKKYWLDMLLDSYLWDFWNNTSWWLLALIVSIPLLLTSNLFSLKKLWKYWKTLHRLSYIMFLLVAIHIAIISNWEKAIAISIIVITYIIIYILAEISKKTKPLNN